MGVIILIGKILAFTIAGIIFLAALAVLIIYLRYRYHKYIRYRRFYMEAEAIYSQQGRAFTMHDRQGLRMMLNASEKKFNQNKNRVQDQSGLL